ncbi:3',5'-cyclic-nucleotide phosphodiesterase [Dirofilaria immitis]
MHHLFGFIILTSLIIISIAEILKCNDMTTQQAIEKRGREINLRCLENKQQLEKCNNRTAVNIAWKNFEEINDNYSATLYSCNEGKRKKRNYECISDNHNHGPRYHYSIEEFKGKLDDSRMKRHVHGTSDDKTDQQVENDNSKDSVRFKRYDCLKDSRREKTRLLDKFAKLCKPDTIYDRDKMDKTCKDNLDKLMKERYTAYSNYITSFQLCYGPIN